MDRPEVNIRRAQKESLFLREILQLFTQAAMDDKRLIGISVSRVSLSDDKSVCTVFFYNSGGIEEFKKIFNVLVLYKPSLRKALAAKIQSRYTPELVFKYDEKFEKQMRLESLFEKIKHEDKP